MRLLAKRTRFVAIRTDAMGTCCDQGQGFIQSSPGPAQAKQKRRQDRFESGDGVGTDDPMFRVNVMFLRGGETAEGVEVVAEDFGAEVLPGSQL